MAAAEQAARRPRVFGRRIGRKLRAARQDALETLLPALRLADPAAPGFARPGPLLVEIGFGGGEHLSGLLRLHPDANLIGAEVFLNGLAACLRRLAAEAHEAPFHDRLRIWPDDARPLLAGLPPASVDRLFLLFPDPWPKARHAGRRMFQPAFLDQAARLLAPGGRLCVATDHPVYRDWVLEVLAAAAGWRTLGREDRAVTDAPRTRYEAKAFREGRFSTWWDLAPA